MEDVVIKVKMLGDFTVEYKNEEIHLSQHFGKQLLNLLQVFLLQHGMEVTKEFLMDELWSESENPASALKFTVFRLRNELKKLPVFASLHLIVTTKNGYKMNPEYTYDCDYDQLEAIYRKLNQQECSEAHIESVQRIMKLYRGSLYMTSSQLIWAAQQQEYYRSAFVWMISNICQYLLKKKRYIETKSIIYPATVLEPFSEELHYYYMAAMVGMKEYRGCLEYYERIDGNFYKATGSGLSSRFKSLYEFVEEDLDHRCILNIEEFHRNLEDENQNREEAFYCAYDVFRHIYELVLRGAPRDPRKFFAILFKVEASLSNEKRMDAVSQLKNIILKTLRNSDIVSKVSDSQMVVLLNCNEVDNVYLIIQRIASQFYKKCSQKHYRLHYHIDEIKNCL